MSKIITSCPSCENAKLRVSEIECTECETQFSGQFEIPALLNLSEGDLQFIFDFVRCSGSLKKMATGQGISYPTLRNRLNKLIETLEKIRPQQAVTKSKILQLVDEGKLSVKEAAVMLIKL
jgi:hypothetical protein